MDPITAAMTLGQFVPQIVKWLTGSKKAGEIADKVVGVAKQVTGTTSADAAIAVLGGNPDKVLEFRKAVLDQEIKIAEIDASVVREVNVTMRAEAAASHWPTYTWRPFIGFSFGFYVNSLWVLPLAHITPVIMGPDIVLAIGGILGVASWFRGKMQADPAVQSDNRG